MSRADDSRAALRHMYTRVAPPVMKRGEARGRARARSQSDYRRVDIYEGRIYREERRIQSRTSRRMRLLRRMTVAGNWLKKDTKRGGGGQRRGGGVANSRRDSICVVEGRRKKSGKETCQVEKRRMEDRSSRINQVAITANSANSHEVVEGKQRTK